MDFEKDKFGRIDRNYQSERLRKGKLVVEELKDYIRRWFLSYGTNQSIKLIFWVLYPCMCVVLSTSLAGDVDNINIVEDRQVYGLTTTLNIVFCCYSSLICEPCCR